MWRRSSSSHVGRAYVPAQDLAGSTEGWLADRWLDILGEGAAAAAQQAEASCPGAVCRRRRRPPMGRRRRRRGAVPLRAPDLLQAATGVPGQPVPGRTRPGRVPALGDPARRRPRLLAAPLVLGGPLRRHQWRVAPRVRHHWSVSAHITLARDADRRHPRRAPQAQGRRGRARAHAGVRVRRPHLGLLPGQMGTNDADTFSYFCGSCVRCVPCPGSPTTPPASRRA